MVKLSILILSIVFFSDINILNNHSYSMNEDESIDEVAISDKYVSTDMKETILIDCTEAAALSDEAMFHNPCLGLSNCGSDTQIFCGSVEIIDPDGPDYTVVCKGRPEPIDA